jgi:prepilin-type N-terminal cleavage/methylation domain-containing protein
MLSLKLKASTSSLGDNRGYTLIEMLVGMVVALVVSGALFAILEISLHQTTLITDKVQANQLGRTAMTRVVDELHSACLSPGFKPIQETSSNTTLVFKNAYSEAAVIPSAKEAKVTGTGVFEHQIVWNEATSTLTDYTYKSTSGEGSEAKFPALDYSTTTREAENAEPKKGALLANHVIETGSTPIFQYYKYATESTSSSSTPVGTLVKQEPPITTKEPETVTAVLVSFRVAPADGKVEHNQYIDLSNQVTFSFSAPNAETPILDSPCE